MLRTITLILLAIGGINWGLVGLFSFDLVAWLCGGGGTLLARIIYTVVALSAVVYLFLAFCDPHHREAH